MLKQALTFALTMQISFVSMAMADWNSGSWRETLQIHGFLEQGFVLSSDNRFYGDSQHGSFDLTSIGLNTSVHPFPNLSFAMQGLYRRSGEQMPEDLRLDYALMDVTAYDSTDFRTGLRLGRVKIPLGLYNETRDAPFTRPSIFLPQSIYFDRTRNFGMAMDGGQWYSELNHPIGDFSFIVNIGQSIPDSSLEFTLLRSNRPGKFKGDFSAITQIAYDYEGGLFRIVVSAGLMNMVYDKGRDPVLKSGTFKYQPYLFGFQYNGDKVSLTAEYAIRNVTIKDFGQNIRGDHENNGESYYFQAGYKINRHIELLARYDVLYTDVSDRYGKKIGRNENTPGHAFFSKDWTAGIRINVTEDLMVRAEYHRVHGTGWLSRAENRNLNDNKRDWDLFAIEAAYQF